MTDLATVAEPGDHLARLAATFVKAKGRKSEHTEDAYRRDLASWLTWALTNGINPLDAWPAHIQLWLAHLGQLGEAGTTQARRLGAVSSFYDWLIRHQTAPRNPAKLTKEERPVRAPRPAAALSDEHAAQLLAAADRDTPRAALIVWLLLHTGLRVTELVTARLGDVGVDRGHMVLHVHGKGGKGRTVVLVPTVVARLDAHLAQRPDGPANTMVLAGQAGAGRDRPLIATATGKPLGRHKVRLLLQRLARAAGLPQAVVDTLSPHSTRATYVTASLASGVSIYDVAQDVGHSSTDTTRGYDRSRYDPARSAAYRLQDRFARHLPTGER
ncbi:tyrosine-type recombinase/integrase [Micromonospora sp. WMMD754]|uniref:tyrosine-type recombinase/integrase n=1 Tax=Micromonospora sp. WMMD754 TaxID=3404114 RepID=UPI003BF51F9C